MVRPTQQGLLEVGTPPAPVHVAAETGVSVQARVDPLQVQLLPVGHVPATTKATLLAPIEHVHAKALSAVEKIKTQKKITKDIKRKKGFIDNLIVG